MTEKAPDAFRTISEVADELDLPQHVLRFWETKFSHIRPTKRSSGRRFYRPEDVALLRSIRDMLYGQGYTIRGVQRLLKERGKSPATEELPSASEAVLPVDTGLSDMDDDDDRIDETSDVELALPVRDALQAVRDELRACAQVLAEARRSRL